MNKKPIGPLLHKRRFSKSSCGLGLLILLVAFAASLSHAQELEPRTYANTPVGMNFLIVGYGYSEGGIATDPSLPLQNANLVVQGPVLAYVRSLNVWGMSGKFNAVVPYACASGTAELDGEPRERNVCGLADPKFRFSVNFYGAPALSVKEFAGYRQEIIAGASLQVTPPLGHYEADKLVNIGTNRWSVKPEIGVSKAAGPVTLELSAAVTFYGENDNYLGDKKREQEPLYGLQGHVIYGFSSGVWAALDITYYTGGRTTVDGTKRDDLQESSRLGATIAVPVDPRNSVKLYFSTGVSTRTGTDFDTAGIAWQYRWGGR